MDQGLQSNNDNLMKIVNEDGRIVPGIFRTPNGAIVFNNTNKLAAYTQQKALITQKDETIDDLSKKIEVLMCMVKGIINESSK